MARPRKYIKRDKVEVTEGILPKKLNLLGAKNISLAIIMYASRDGDRYGGNEFLNSELANICLGILEYKGDIQSLKRNKNIETRGRKYTGYVFGYSEQEFKEFTKDKTVKEIARAVNAHENLVRFYIKKLGAEHKRCVNFPRGKAIAFSWANENDDD